MNSQENSNEPKRGLIASGIHNLFALFFGITPPARGQEGFYAAIMLGIVVAIIVVGWVFMRVLLHMLMS
ncbi:MAG: hypothetical protein P4M01_14780 [Acidobacteriota bacterium]|nr:hypothetical protein [Acidobacteriota bacterium]